MQDTTIGGVDVREGQLLFMPHSITNRDPRQFENQDEFIPERSLNRHTAFGFGIHRCIGSHLARLELRITLEEFLRRLPEFEPDADAAPSWSMGQTGGMTSVPVRFRAPSPAGRAPRS
ncbi:cytochrome P450 [Pseudonocardia sp. Ae707_Ps1]|uniref:cytochrome P450 n=1 Tax=Pseudonocardia sp. Ae707_Ps1 TaxID=1885572 RepID=UPI0024B3223B|nr:cytochrome P450 [Pseudonocardia sp. Ae707_Ps1]